MALRFRNDYIRKTRPSAFREQVGGYAATKPAKLDPGVGTVPYSGCNGVGWAAGISFDAIVGKCGVPYAATSAPDHQCSDQIWENDAYTYINNVITPQLEQLVKDYTRAPLNQGSGAGGVDITTCADLYHELDGMALNLAFNFPCPCTGHPNG